MQIILIFYFVLKLYYCLFIYSVYCIQRNSCIVSYFVKYIFINTFLVIAFLSVLPVHCRKESAWVTSWFAEECNSFKIIYLLVEYSQNKKG